MSPLRSALPASPWPRYRLVLGQSAAWRFFLPAAWGRVGVAMTGIGLLWVVQTTTGSFATAGAVTGTFALAEAIAGPQVARLFDRYGQSWVLVLLVAVHVLSVAGVVSSAASGQTSTLVLYLAAAAAGASLPQLGACSAARWTQILTDRSLLRTAFALETMANDIAFLLGPTAVVAVAVSWHLVAGASLAAGLVASGGLVLAAVRQPRQERTTQQPTSRGGRGLLRSGFMSIVVVNLGLGAVFGSMQLAVTASAGAAGQPALAGALYSLLALGSLIGGFSFGSRAWKSSPALQLCTAASCLLVMTGVLATATDLAWSAVAIALLGLAVAPIMVLSGSMVERAVSPLVITQAYSWTASASAGGLASAAAAAGYLVDQHGAHAALVVTAAAAAVILCGAAAQSRTGRSQIPDGSAGPSQKPPF